jgi:formylglycine-generating enzyme required for sulfatase activity
VTLKSFYLCKYEVTQSQWQAIMGNQPSQNKGCAECPVEYVSWSDAQHFVDKLNQLTGGHYILPTEAQWEYAARGGNLMTSRSTKLERYGWFFENAGGKTHPIGRLAANEKGIFDMNGNVAEWCNDWYDNTYYRISKLEDPPGPETAQKERSLRGGSFDDYETSCRVSARFHGQPDQRLKSVGFRLARAAP